MIELTKEEVKAIAARHKLEKKWPETLWLLSFYGSLRVMKKDGVGGLVGRVMDQNDEYDPAYEVADICIETDGAG